MKTSRLPTAAAVFIAFTSLAAMAKEKPAVPNYREAIEQLDAAIQDQPDNAALFFQRGVLKFKSGEVEGSVADFDRQIELAPSAEKSHWQRGISYYYAGHFRDGQRQFELYQTFDDNDVENVVWRFLCQARVDGVEKARAAMLGVRLDRRVPMMTIYDLFLGKATVDDVFAKTTADKPGKAALNAREFYAHLYVGLYYEALGKADLASRHIRQAVEHKIGHYMWDVARVHHERLKNTSS